MDELKGVQGVSPEYEQAEQARRDRKMGVIKAIKAFISQELGDDQPGFRDIRVALIAVEKLHSEMSIEAAANYELGDETFVQGGEAIGRPLLPRLVRGGLGANGASYEAKLVDMISDFMKVYLQREVNGAKERRAIRLFDLAAQFQEKKPELSERFIEMGNKIMASDADEEVPFAEANVEEGENDENLHSDVLRRLDAGEGNGGELRPPNEEPDDGRDAGRGEDPEEV